VGSRAGLRGSNSLNAFFQIVTLLRVDNKDLNACNVA
jgi:hypothetical protein